ncbi:unnamed protein product [[Actinomadura] parvosata subsp. kistnae]|uniref:DUF4350 domain-containing protein n=1 Tax=[Actinomadura] parvosata subsp. kistnae TaxID=1909395 RepID=A0A1V0A4B2_9ACTN|nr:DUF6421 family protein [Nonomuraea sp. ATCC 55076]AQZ65047.1 hypothetical protein BKM31_29575 [Nonomuraea sp. ATCC 55076]SPL96304.1 unnamed protein product [Actinomadura parvosata subsp. kistnae]
MRSFPRVLFDEAHNESWTIRRELAESVNPAHPDDTSYARAAGLLRHLGHTVTAHTAGPLGPETLAEQDVLVIAHPSDERWERTTGQGSPVFTAAELDAVEAFVAGGGGLVVLAEEEQDKYGNNLRELLARFGVDVRHTTVRDPRHAHQGVATWVLGERSSGSGLLAGVRTACFYRAGTLVADGADVLFATSADADPAGEPLAVALRHGRGRVVVFADSDLFGDDSIEDHDHRALWRNVVTWAARLPGDDDRTGAAREAVDSDGKAALFARLKAAVEELRPLQVKDGSVPAESKGRAKELVAEIADRVGEISPYFPHDAAYLQAVQADLTKWAEQDLGVPDFLDSLDLFHPDTQRVDGLEHVVVFPMYTQNGNPSRNLEAVWIRTIWPAWLAELEAGGYDNPMFVPIAFEDFTSGYDTHSAVLFPETVAVRQAPARFTWGGIFADREAARFRRVAGAAVETLRLDLPPDAERLLASQRLAQDTFVLWDLVHDRTHSHGDLPFDPFMIKQRMPYWLYALEELRCDLTAFGEAVELERRGVPYARYVQLAILFDRLFRFPVTGERVRNYDGLGGQLLFAYLHRNDIVRWTDNRLSIDWERVADGVADLRGEVEKLYRDSIDRSKLAHWLAAYELVSAYVAAHPASTWAKGVAALPEEQKAKVDAVLPDEFPLSMFYEALRRKLTDVVESTKGLRA